MIHYEIYNENAEEALVLVHGFGGSTRTWKKQIDAFSKDYKVIAIDLPGHGQSQNGEVQEISAELISDSINDVLDTLGIKKAHFVGLSLGSMVAVDYAIKNPERVSRLVLGGAVLKFYGLQKIYLLPLGIAKFFLPHKFLYKIIASIVLPRKHQRRSRDIFIREALKMSKESFIVWMEYLTHRLINKDFFKAITEIKNKILIISGREDIFFINAAHKTANSLIDGDIKEIAKCGHICNIEQSTEFNNLTLDFLKKIA